ncbi:MAG TPA: nitroreductase [Bordetella sp.]
MTTLDPALQALQSRQSLRFVRGPGPSDEELAQILQAGMSAPDHGALRPWRYVIIRGEAVGKLADMALDAVKRTGDPRMTPDKEKNVRAWLADVPLVLGVAQKSFFNGKIPEHEQMLAVGASVMNVLNAAYMLGYGAFWSTGLGTHVPEVQEALGFDPLEYRFLGFLAIGTPAVELPKAQRSDYREFVTEWSGA